MAVGPLRSRMARKNCQRRPLTLSFAAYWETEWTSLRGDAERLAFLVAQEPAGLPAPHARIEAVAAQKIGMCALLGDAALIEHDQPIEPRDGREPMRNGDDGLLLDQGRERVLDRRLDFGIERRRCLVEHQDRRVFQNHAGNGNALTLAPGEFYAALADMRLIAASPFMILLRENEVVGLRAAGGFDDLGFARLGPAVSDVVADRAVQKRRVLRHDSDVAAKRVLA